MIYLGPGGKWCDYDWYKVVVVKMILSVWKIFMDPVDWMCPINNGTIPLT
jgi:hypothetical protein